MNALIVCNEVSKIYQSDDSDIAVHALSKVSLTINSGEFVSLFGPSGSGKTTLLNLIGGLDLPSSGEIIVADQPLHKMSRAERANFRLNNIGFIFQSYNLIPVLSALENVEFVMQIQGVKAELRRKRARDILREVGLLGLEDRRPAELSGGQQQRVAVARAIVSEPKLVLADEPTANLDSHTAEDLIDLMSHMNTEHGVTFVFSTHDKLVMDHAKRLVGLRDGAIVSDVRKT